MNDGRVGETTIYTCPDCGGVLWQEGNRERLWFRCHVGHGYAPEVLLGAKAEELEAALWTSMRLLRERGTLAKQVTGSRGTAGWSPEIGARMDEQAQLDERYAQLIRELLESFPAPVEDADGERPGGNGRSKQPAN